MLLIPFPFHFTFSRLLFLPSSSPLTKANPLPFTYSFSSPPLCLLPLPCSLFKPSPFSCHSPFPSFNLSLPTLSRILNSSLTICFRLFYPLHFRSFFLIFNPCFLPLFIPCFLSFQPLYVFLSMLPSPPCEECLVLTLTRPAQFTLHVVVFVYILSNANTQRTVCSSLPYYFVFLYHRSFSLTVSAY